MIDNLIWDEISLEVLKAARSGMAVKDFELHCRLAPITNGKSFFDRIRVAESLIQDKLISIDDGYLKIANKMLPESLVNKLITGLPIAWEITSRSPQMETFIPARGLPARKNTAWGMSMITAVKT